MSKLRQESILEHVPKCPTFRKSWDLMQLRLPPDSLLQLSATLTPGTARGLGQIFKGISEEMIK